MEQQAQPAGLVDHIGAAMAGRLPLEDTLEALSEDTSDRDLAKAAALLAAELRRGQPLQRAIDLLDHRLPRRLRSLLEVGVRCGDPTAVFETFATQQLATRRISQTIRLTLAQPLLVLIVLVPIALFLAMYVIPMFEELFNEFDLALPRLTQVVLNVARDLPTFLAALVLVPLALTVGVRLVGGRWLWHRVRAAIPLVGKLWAWSGQRELAGTLAAFLELRIPAADAFAYSAEMLNDRSLAHACRLLSERSRTGQALSDAMADSIYFDRVLTALVRWGEDHQLVPEALRQAVDFFDQRTHFHASLARRLMPALTFIFVGLVAFTVVIGLYLPLFDLVNGLV